MSNSNDKPRDSTPQPQDSPPGPEEGGSSGEGAASALAHMKSRSKQLKRLGAEESAHGGIDS
jgi:hypothetical protein